MTLYANNKKIAPTNIVYEAPIEIPREVINGTMQKMSHNYTFALPESAKDLESNALDRSFSGDNYITSVDLSSLERISGERALGATFSVCTSIASVDFSNLELVSGQDALREAFTNCHSLTSVSFPSLTTVSGFASFWDTFSNSSGLSEVNFPALTVISGDYAMMYAFSSCTSLVSVSFPVLTTISGYLALPDTFGYCSSLKSISFPKLKNFGNYTNQLSSTFTSCTDITIHFRADMEDTIKSLTGYSATAPFGATSGTVLFDLATASITFNLTNLSDTSALYLDGELKSGLTANNLSGDTSYDYLIYDSTSNKAVVIGTTPVIVDGTSSTINITYNTSSPGVMVLPDSPSSGAICYFYINGVQIEVPASLFAMLRIDGLLEGTPIPFLYLSQTKEPYFGEATLGQATNITLTPATWQTFIRPNLTSNGTLGGDSFAVSAEAVSYEPAYYAVDDPSNNTHWEINDINSDAEIPFIIYNPNYLKVSSIDMDFDAGMEAPSTVTLLCSLDGETWETPSQTYEFSMPVGTITLESLVLCKYLKLLLKGNGTFPYLFIKNIDFNALECVPT